MEKLRLVNTVLLVAVPCEVESLIPTLALSYYWLSLPLKVVGVLLIPLSQPNYCVDPSFLNASRLAENQQLATFTMQADRGLMIASVALCFDQKTVY